ncbi:MAG TPA: DUF459 domain-containing protein [Pseudolabrys sp.]|nr:DUF459 domain-containing protein [Pseudolabrys sp.]
MVGGRQSSRRLIGVLLLAAFEALSLLVLAVSVPSPAQAQWWGDRPPGFIRRAPPPRDGGGFFENLFGGGRDDRDWRREPAPRRYRARPEPQRQVDYSHAPAPSKEAKPEPGVPVTSIVVMGDGMADWLAYGLEDAFSDTPNVEIVRKAKQYSGLIHYQAHSDLDWWHVAREILAKQKPNYVVMMLGIHDRQSISERDLAKEAEKQEAEKKAAAQPNADAGKDAAGKDSAAEETAKRQLKTAIGPLEFRTDQWAKAYSHRIDETIAALKSKGVPVFWVGLPSIRGTKSTADALYLNELYRARAERDGAVYIDVWDGFVDDSGKYTSYGPDYEGQMRRLRTPDGVFFTKYGARKLAHYVEREIRRYMNNRAVVALPTGPVAPVPGNGSPAARPLAGPVVPLTSISGGGDTLLGAAGTQPPPSDTIAASVLVKGEALNAPPGRADDHVWPPGSAAYGHASKAEAAAAPGKVAPSSAAAKPALPTVAAVPATPPQRAAPAGAPAARSAPEETKKTTPEPKAKAAAKVEASVTAKPPVEARKEVESKPIEAKTPARSRHERARRSERHEASRPLPPRRIERRSREAQAPRPSRQSDDGLFGRDGLFGWMR